MQIAIAFQQQLNFENKPTALNCKLTYYMTIILIKFISKVFKEREGFIYELII